MAWGIDGHFLVCSIAQTMFTQSTLDAVHGLLPEYAAGNLSRLCSWADDVKFKYRWSSPLHYIDTPDNLCTYSYTRDCYSGQGVEGMCAAGAINNYTSQLTNYNSSESTYNLTEALLFLAHITGDIHQPLHVGFTSDKGGNTILVHWYQRKENLHHVWDDEIIYRAVSTLYGSDIQAFRDDIAANITDNDAMQWGSCDGNYIACPDIYAKESVNAACTWAYKDASSGSYLGDNYFNSRLPIVEQRIARGGVRLASILNNLFS